MRDSLKLYGSKKLATPTSPVGNIDAKIVNIAQKMKSLCRGNIGVGLAANQIGRSESIFVYEHRNVLRVAINPIISEHAGTVVEVEGCLSFPGVFYPIERPRTCLLSAWDENGEHYELEGEHLTARVMLHEHDHLLGKTMVDLLNEDQLKDFKTQWPKKRQEHFSKQR